VIACHRTTHGELAKLQSQHIAHLPDCSGLLDSAHRTVVARFYVGLHNGIGAVRKHRHDKQIKVLGGDVKIGFWHQRPVSFSSKAGRLSRLSAWRLRKFSEKLAASQRRVHRFPMDGLSRHGNRTSAQGTTTGRIAGKALPPPYLEARRSSNSSSVRGQSSPNRRLRARSARSFPPV